VLGGYGHKTSLGIVDTPNMRGECLGTILLLGPKHRASEAAAAKTSPWDAVTSKLQRLPKPLEMTRSKSLLLYQLSGTFGVPVCVTQRPWSSVDRYGSWLYSQVYGRSSEDLCDTKCPSRSMECSCNNVAGEIWAQDHQRKRVSTGYGPEKGSFGHGTHHRQSLESLVTSSKIIHESEILFACMKCMESLSDFRVVPLAHKSSSH